MKIYKVSPIHVYKITKWCFLSFQDLFPPFWTVLQVRRYWVIRRGYVDLSVQKVRSFFGYWEVWGCYHYSKTTVDCLSCVYLAKVFLWRFKIDGYLRSDAIAGPRWWLLIAMAFNGGGCWGSGLVMLDKWNGIENRPISWARYPSLYLLCRDRRTTDETILVTPRGALYF